MARINLTPKKIESFLKKENWPPKGKRYDYWDGIVPGMEVQVTDTGYGSFKLMRRYPAKPTKPTRRLLGCCSAITLETARKTARGWIESIEKGIDPKIDAARKKAAERRKAMSTFRTIATEYLDRHKNLAKHAEAKRILEAEFIKRWGDRPAADILPEEVADAIRAIVKRGATYQAHNALGHLRRVYNWAIGVHEFGLVTSPVTALKPKDLIGGKQKRTHILSEAELRAVWTAAAGKYEAPKNDKKRIRAPAGATEMGYPYGPLIRLLILTGQRENEIAGIKWDEVDFETKLLTIPASRMKGKDARTHEVPLAPDALALLKSLPRFKGPHVFTTTDGLKPVNGFSKAKVRIDKLSKVTGWIFHDLRRTMRTHLSALPVQDMVRELVIAHAQPGLHQVYDQHSYRDEKRQCLVLWERRLAGIIKPKVSGEVAHLDAARVKKAS